MSKQVPAPKHHASSTAQEERLPSGCCAGKGLDGCGNANAAGGGAGGAVLSCCSACCSGCDAAPGLLALLWPSSRTSPSSMAERAAARWRSMSSVASTCAPGLRVTLPLHTC